MTAGGEEPKNEFANFLDDITEEISHRVESFPAPLPSGTGEHRVFSEDRHVLDWPSVVDRMIDEMR